MGFFQNLPLLPFWEQNHHRSPENIVLNRKYSISGIGVFIPADFYHKKFGYYSFQSNKSQNYP